MSPLKNVFLALLSLLITACSTISYQEPTSGPVAKVRFSTKHDGIVIVRNYKAENCTQEEEWMRLKNGFLLNSSPKKLNMALWNYHDNAAKEFLVTPSEEKYFMFFGSEQIGSTVYSCAVPVSVIFKPNHDYELLYKFGIGQCSVVLSEITKTDKGHIKETKNVYINVLNSKTMNCSKSFSKARWY